MPKITPANCADCAHHSSKQVPKNVDVSFDEYIETSDETATLYICMKNRESPIEIGREARRGSEVEHCFKHSMSEKAIKEADLAMARFERRMNKKV